MAKNSESKPKREKEAPFSKFQALVILLLLAVTGFLLIHRTKVTNTSHDAWGEILTQYGCKHTSDIPGNLSDGASGGCVKFAQFLLEVGSNQFHVLGENYDAATKAQVVDFQQRNNLSATGNIDATTWTKLEGCINVTASAGGSVWKCQQIKAYQ